jgi:hypothetical protein
MTENMRWSCGNSAYPEFGPIHLEAQSDPERGDSLISGDGA